MLKGCRTDQYIFAAYHSTPAVTLRLISANSVLMAANAGFFRNIVIMFLQMSSLYYHTVLPPKQRHLYVNVVTKLKMLCP